MGCWLAGSIGPLHWMEPGHYKDGIKNPCPTCGGYGTMFDWQNKIDVLCENCSGTGTVDPKR